MTPEPLRLVIFDCDGVLVDSEGPSARVCAAAITELGWSMTADECMRRFVGYTLEDMPPVIEAEIGRPVPPDWVEQVRGRMIAAFSTVETMPGAAEAIRTVAALGLPVRVASNSSHAEMDMKFGHTRLDALVARGRRHSAHDVALGKPAPDVYLAAAHAEGVPPGACLVIEDSLPGIAAARAAGMAVVALAPHGTDAALQATGARPIQALSELEALLTSAMRRAA